MCLFYIPAIEFQLRLKREHFLYDCDHPAVPMNAIQMVGLPVRNRGMSCHVEYIYHGTNVLQFFYIEGTQCTLPINEYYRPWLDHLLIIAKIKLRMHVTARLTAWGRGPYSTPGHMYLCNYYIPREGVDQTRIMSRKREGITPIFIFARAFQRGAIPNVHRYHAIVQADALPNRRVECDQLLKHY